MNITIILIIWFIGCAISYKVLHSGIEQAIYFMMNRGQIPSVSMWILNVMEGWLCLCCSWCMLFIALPVYFFFRNKNKELESDDFIS